MFNVKLTCLWPVQNHKRRKDENKFKTFDWTPWPEVKCCDFIVLFSYLNVDYTMLGSVPSTDCMNWTNAQFSMVLANPDTF